MIKIPFEKIVDFGFRLCELRLDFPEFAKEIDRLHYEAGKIAIAPCEHERCACKMSFEDFHKSRNDFFKTQSEVKEYDEVF